jgi:hypothetical protein
MTLDELRQLCQEAARDLVARHDPPLPAAVVLPLPSQTHVTTLDGFPDDDEQRFTALSHFAADRMVPASAPCFGFVAEAELAADDGPVDVVVVAYGARQRGTWVTAAPLDAGRVGEFSASEQLDPAALPFLRPLQHAADLASTPGEGGEDVLGIG